MTMSNPLLPSVAKTKLTKGSIIVAVLATALTGAYAMIALTQAEGTPAERDELPASVRSSPGGYRSYHFWHSGYNGGK
jgi:hypothetical protein